MSPWMHSDTRPDAARERCGNCGVPWEEHAVLVGLECDDPGCDGHRLCADGRYFRPESDEDRIADRAAARGL